MSSAMRIAAGPTTAPMARLQVATVSWYACRIVAWRRTSVTAIPRSRSEAVTAVTSSGSSTSHTSACASKVTSAPRVSASRSTSAERPGMAGTRMTRPADRAGRSLPSTPVTSSPSGSRRAAGSSAGIVGGTHAGVSLVG